jgi:uncharacterized protein (TIGR03663 family)
MRAGKATRGEIVERRSMRLLPPGASCPCGPTAEGDRPSAGEQLFFAAAFLAIVGLGALVRLADLGNRPMHCDEAVHAIKFGRLLEQADYVYDPREYHGPSLNYLTLPVAWLTRSKTLADVTEVHLRLVPAIFGILLVALAWLLRPWLGWPGALMAALLTALSPAMVFYSRYYIQEMLLVCFSFGSMLSLWRFAQDQNQNQGQNQNESPFQNQVPTQDLASAQTSGQAAAAKSSPRHFVSAILHPLASHRWLVLFGICLGMTHVSKETCVIAMSALLVAVFCASPLWRMGWKRLAGAAVLAAMVTACVSMLFFSSFGQNPRGIIDSITTYFYYLGRASGEGTAGRHHYPWYQYFQWLFWWRGGNGRIWSEGTIALLALVGAWAGWLGRGLTEAQRPTARMFAIYAVLMTAVYAALPYKTPWCALGFLHGLILLAAVGTAALWRVVPRGFGQAALLVVLAAMAGHLGWQAWRASFLAAADPDNPHVYAHTSEDVPILAERIRQLANAYPDPSALPIQLICPHHDYWPLPWYLRGFAHLGYYDDVPEGIAAPVIVTMPRLERALAEWLYDAQPPGQRHLYMLLPPPQKDRDWVLRPRPLVTLVVYVRQELWNAWQSQQSP